MSRRTTLLAWALWVLAVALTGVFLGLVVADAGSPGPLEFAETPAITVVYALLALTLPSVGLVLATRVPANAIGWMFLASGSAIAGGFAATLYADYATYVRPDLPAGRYFAGGNNLFIVGLVLMTMFLLFVFPTGRPLTPAWRRCLQALAVLFSVGLVATLARPGPVHPFADIDNPLGLPGAAGSVATALSLLLEVSAPPFFALGVWAIVARYRRAQGIERAQLQWFAFAAGLVGAALAVGFTLSGLGLQRASDVMWVAAMLALLLLPVAVGVAILRYRLFDIDRLVSRTVTYAAVTLVLALVYGAGVLGIGAFAGRSSDLAVAGATLAVAALFRPARRRLQDLVDRRFNRARYDARRTVEQLTERLRSAGDLDDLEAELRRVVGEALQPAAASLWLRRSP